MGGPTLDCRFVGTTPVQATDWGYPLRVGKPSKQAVFLVSGGMDSAVVLAAGAREGFEAFALTVNYGQRHACELQAAARVCRAAGVREHRTVAVDLAALGGSALTDDLAVPKQRPAAEIGAATQGIPVTYVPARNALFLTIALGWAETLGAADLFCGVNAVDYSGYPDCRPEFLRAFESMAAQATAAGAERGVEFRVHAPLLDLSKRRIVELGRDLDVDFALTHTCYDPLLRGETWLSCGACDACTLRLAGFREAGCEDPIPYA